jgi:CubicO group peptidase (beta-lactamase class C family)
VDDGRLPGWLVAVSRQGRLAHVSCYGSRDIEAGLPVEADTLWRIYSMTKPITSVAAMMLYEEGAFELSDRVSTFIPAFANVRVYTGGSDQRQVTVPASEPVRIWHLLTHTAGLTYGFLRVHPVDALYRAAGFEWSVPRGMDLATACEAWAATPLLFQPGTEWNYSVATDVLARLDAMGRVARKPVRMNSGGGGLLATGADYHRFLHMLLDTPGSPAGELDGSRLLSSRTVGYMARNHLPGGLDLETFGRPLYAESPFAGVGFGLGFGVVIDPVQSRVVCSEGELTWGGAASTTFWIDQREELAVAFYTQLLPSSTYRIRPQLRQLVYQALTG